MRLYGEGEWKVRLHGKEKLRTWRKLHLLIDHTTHEAVALSMTGKDVLDRRELPGLPGTVEGEVAEVLGDGAYDFQDCYKRASGHPAAGAGASQGQSLATATRRWRARARSGAANGRRRPTETARMRL